MTFNDEQLIAQAIAARNAGHAPDWIPRLEQRLQQTPDNSRLWHTLGTIWRAELETKRAIAAFSRAHQIDRTSAVTAHALARATLEAGLPAVDLYDKALTLAPGDSAILIGRAAALSAEGRTGQAIDEFRRLLRSNPRWVDGHRHLAEMLVAEGCADEHLATLDEAIGKYPHDPRLRAMRLDILYRGQQFAELAAFANVCEQALGKSEGLAIYKAIALSELGELAQADTLFGSILPTNSAELASHAMRHHLRSGRPEAAAAIGEPLRNAPGANHVWSWLGTAWRLLGDSRADWLYRPDLVQTFDLLDQGRIEGLTDLLRGLHRARSACLGQSVRRGTQTDGPLFARTEPEIVALRTAITAQITAYIAALADDPEHPVLATRPARPRITGSWSVRLLDGGHHANHVHPEGWISAALYFVTPSGTSDDPHAGWLALGQPPTELNLALKPLRLIEPVPGKLVLFPATMWHGTHPIASGERLAVAFDVAARNQK